MRRLTLSDKYQRDRLYDNARKVLHEFTQPLSAIHCDEPELRPHPLSVKLYGKPAPSAELIASIKSLGILNPILVNEDFEVLSGNQRLKAYQILHKKHSHTFPIWIPIRRTDAVGLEAEQLVLEENRQRVKTAEQKGREFKELKRIETELAKERQKLSKERKRIEAESDIEEGQENFPYPTGQARDKAAEVIGMSGRTAEKLEAIIDASDDGDENASAALREIDRKNGRGIDSAYTAVVKPKSSKDPELVASLEKSARDLTDVLKRSGIAAEVTRSKSDGKFHLSWHDATAEQIQKFAGTFKEKLR